MLLIKDFNVFANLWYYSRLKNIFTVKNKLTKIRSDALNFKTKMFITIFYIKE